MQSGLLLEHAFRFAKGHLGLTAARVRTPEQADRWVRLVMAASAELLLARPLAADLRRPWEKRPDPARPQPAPGGPGPAPRTARPRLTCASRAPAPRHRPWPVSPDPQKGPQIANPARHRTVQHARYRNPAAPR